MISLTVALLGPLVVAMDGRPVDLSAHRLRTLLVVLATEAGSPVSVDRIAAALWDDDPPRFLRRSVQTYVARLRSVLGTGSIRTEPAGYRLLVEREQVDALRFVGLLDAAAQAPDPATERTRLDSALRLWRGIPFDGVPSQWLDGPRARLVERYLAAVERLVDLDLADGRPAESVEQLRTLTATHPLRESLWVRLLTVLDRAGRTAEALASYESVRQRLAEELGVDPGPELRQVHADLLSEDHPPGAPPAGVVVPRQLPADIDGFTGRGVALKALRDLLRDAGEPSARAVVISAIGGMAGIGKTALAVHWSHQVQDRFPDGQLYVNLRGFHPSGQAMAPAQAIRGFLDALGVPSTRIPSDLDAQVGLYRTLLSERRMLVLLDNARDPDQVRPLLPGGSTCVVVVTSRSRLIGLVAKEVARPLVLDVLPVDEARELLAARLGQDRIAAEREAADAVIARCAGLPLALAVAAARAATSALPLATVAAQLDDEKSTLDALGGGEPAADTRAVFSWSYRTLSPPAAQLFRYIGLHPGPDVGIVAVASLAGVTVERIRPVLAELGATHLVTEPAPGRYALHDLLRSYANELVHSHDGDLERWAAQHRLLDHYLQTANAAALLINPRRHKITIASPQPGVTLEHLADDAHAMAWGSVEHRVLLAVIAHAAVAGFDTHSWQLAWAVSEYLYRRGYWHDWRSAYTTALAAARRAGDHRGAAITHRGLAMACSNLGQHDAAQPHLFEALALYERLGDRIGEAHTHVNVAASLARRHRYADALDHDHRALDLYVTAGDEIGEALALNTAGFLYAELGDHKQALHHCHRSAALFRRLGDRGGLGSTSDSIGYIYYRHGSHQKAIRHFRRAAAVFDELGYRFSHAETLDHLGDTYLAAGDAAAARQAWTQARDMFDESGHPQADKVRAKLGAMP